MTPAARLVELLADARRTGQRFPDAWPAALQRALTGADDADAWRAALAGTAEAWAASFERQPPSRAQRALVAVADDPDRQLAPELQGAFYGFCPHCDGPIATARTNAVYCSDRCRRDAHSRRPARIAA